MTQFPYNYPALLTGSVYICPRQLKPCPPQCNLCHDLHWFHYLLVPVQSHATSIVCIKPHAKLTQSNLLTFFIQIPWYLIWVKHLTYNKLSLEQLNLKYKVCTILFKMISAPSLFTSYLFMQLPLQSPPKISSKAAGTFCRATSSSYLLFYLIILTISTKTPCIPQTFFTSLFLHTAIPAIPT